MEIKDRRWKWTSRKTMYDVYLCATWQRGWTTHLICKPKYVLSTGLRRDWQTRFLMCHLSWQLEDATSPEGESLEPADFNRGSAGPWSAQPSYLWSLRQRISLHGNANGGPQLMDIRQSTYTPIPCSSFSPFSLAEFKFTWELYEYLLCKLIFQDLFHL